MSLIGTQTVLEINGIAFQVTDIRGPSISGTAIDMSYMNMTTPFAKPYVGGALMDPGEVTFDILFDPSQKAAIKDLFEDADLDGTLDEANLHAGSLTFPTGDEWTFNGFVTRFEPGVPLEDKMTASVTFKISGAITQA